MRVGKHKLVRGPLKVTLGRNQSTFIYRVGEVAIILGILGKKEQETSIIMAIMGLLLPLVPSDRDNPATVSAKIKRLRKSFEEVRKRVTNG